MKVFQLLMLMAIFTSNTAIASPVEYQDSVPAAKTAPSDAGLSQAQVRYMIDMVSDVKKIVGQEVDPQLALLIGLCSEAAAHPDDPGKYGKGIDYSKIDTNKAIPSCLKAYNNGGAGIGLVNATLSRAYNKAEQYEQSLKYARQALELRYPFADVLMGIFYEYGDGVEKSSVQSFGWYKNAAEKGIASAMRITSQHYIKGEGTAKNLNQGLPWAVKAVKAKDGKAFYQLGLALETLGQEKSDARPYVTLAKRAFQIADENFVNVNDDLLRVNQALSPNNIAEAAILDRPTIKGRNVNGIFIPLEESRSWYLGETTLQDGNKHYAYARTSLNNSRFTLWFENNAAIGESGWYVEFLYGGSSVITDFYGVRVIPKDETGAARFDLDISDPHIEERLGIYRLTARISSQDVFILKDAGLVKFRYDNARGNHSRYTFPLNDDNAPANASSALTALIETAKTMDPSCCEAPKLMPFTKTYNTWLDSCEDDALSQSFKGQFIRQDCEQIIQNAESMSDLTFNQHDRSIERILRKVSELTGL